MASSGVILILGAGPRLGTAIASKFKSKGYEVAVAARSVSEGISPEGFLRIKCDLSDPSSLPAVFKTVGKSLGLPNIVVYNGANRLTTPPADPLSASFDTVRASRTVGFDSAYIAAQEALRTFRSLPKSTPKAFVYTGNALSQIAIPGIMPFAFGKVAAMTLVEYAANAYHTDGYRFYYADQREPDGRPVGLDIDGAAHAEMYWELANEPKQTDWLVTFTKAEGRRPFVGVDFDGNTRASYAECLGRN